MIVTRTFSVPNVQTYSTTTGWSDSTAQTADVPVTLDNHTGVPITFNEQILASTARRLFDEFAPAQSYALGKRTVDALYANLTDANFPNNTVIASASFTRSSVTTIETALDLRGVPQVGRTLNLWSTAFQGLIADTALVTFAAYQRLELVTGP